MLIHFSGHDFDEDGKIDGGEIFSAVLHSAAAPSGAAKPGYAGESGHGADVEAWQKKLQETEGEG